MSEVIRLRGLTKQYKLGLLKSRKVIALSNLDLTVAAGSVLGVLGPNGAGKSTAIKLMMNIIRPTSGTVELFGRSPEDTAARRDVGYLPENPSPYEYLTGYEFVELGAVLSGVPSSERRKRVTEVLEQVHMSAAAHLQIRRYSKGMVQRASLAQALVARPRLLILDEPTSGLDILGRQLIRDIIATERARGATVLLCSHIIPDVEVLCDQVAVIIGGKLMKEGPVGQLLSQGASDMELVVENAADSFVSEAQRLGASVDRAGGRLTIKGTDTVVTGLLPNPALATARVISLQRTRYSLEQLFLDAMKNAGQTVGGLIE